MASSKKHSSQTRMVQASSVQADKIQGAVSCRNRENNLLMEVKIMHCIACVVAGRNDYFSLPIVVRRELKWGAEVELIQL